MKVTACAEIVSKYTQNRLENTFFLDTCSATEYYIENKENENNLWIILEINKSNCIGKVNDRIKPILFSKFWA